MARKVAQLLSAGAAWVSILFILSLLVIGLTAICRAERKDIPAALRALATWLPWGAKRFDR